ncbi:metallophosphoesterase family protein [Rhizobium sp. LjRoot30]|uniref:metallophosphoesterase family protein n=1 Tax=Rhizobium sp. LjRoot30 TaxID=3342320 RepID=UPI003ECD54CE
MRFIRKLLGMAEQETFADHPRARLRYEAGDFAAIYAVGDVHGCHREMIDAERRIIEDSAAEKGPVLVVYLGDYIDRGPASNDVVEHLCSVPPAGLERITLCGNHEDTFLRFLDAPTSHRGWLDWGGHEMLASYGVDVTHILQTSRSFEAVAEAAMEAIPERHIRLLRALPVLLEVGKLVFAHAGIRPGVAIEEQTDRDLLWIREPFLSEGAGLPLLVIHGHTPTDEPVFAKGRIGIDTAAFATGRLTVLKVAGNQARIL